MHGWKWLKSSYKRMKSWLAYGRRVVVMIFSYGDSVLHVMFMKVLKVEDVFLLY